MVWEGQDTRHGGHGEGLMPQKGVGEASDHLRLSGRPLHLQLCPQILMQTFQQG